MPQVSHVIVDQVLGRHTDTHISATSTGTDAHASVSVDSSTTYCTVFEAGGMTFKFTDNDHIILAPGDRVRVAWVMRYDGVRTVLAMVNESRGISRRLTVDPTANAWIAMLATVAAVFMALPKSFSVDAADLVVSPTRVTILAVLCGAVYSWCFADHLRKTRFAAEVNGSVGL